VPTKTHTYHTNRQHLKAHSSYSDIKICFFTITLFFHIHNIFILRGAQNVQICQNPTSVPFTPTVLPHMYHVYEKAMNRDDEMKV
jgi:hypothetical protein